ncbi:hypothetical protein ABZP36_023566 [Zizania latifolia]
MVVPLLLGGPHRADGDGLHLGDRLRTPDQACYALVAVACNSGGSKLGDELCASKAANNFFGCSNATKEFEDAKAITEPNRYLMIATSGGLNQQQTGCWSWTGSDERLRNLQEFEARRTTRKQAPTTRTEKEKKMSKWMSSIKFGGRLVYQYTKKRASGSKCPVIGKKIQGILMREDGRKQVCIVGLQEFEVSDVQIVKKYIKRGNAARTVMISCISPSAGSCEHTLNTLRYADRVHAAAAQRQAREAEGANGTSDVESNGKKDQLVLDICVICLQREYNAVFVP